MCIMTRMTFLLTFRIVNGFKSVVQINVNGETKSRTDKNKTRKTSKGRAAA